MKLSMKDVIIILNFGPLKNKKMALLHWWKKAQILGNFGKINNSTFLGTHNFGKILRHVIMIYMYVLHVYAKLQCLIIVESDKILIWIFIFSNFQKLWQNFEFFFVIFKLCRPYYVLQVLAQFLRCARVVCYVLHVLLIIGSTW